MHVIGLLGGVAGGKSFVATEFARLGAGVFDADAAAHQVLQLPRIRAAARRRWGDTIFAPDGRIDRPRLGRIVFAQNPAGIKEREYLETLTHAEIAARLRRQAEEMARSGVPAAVLDVPLLIEAAWDANCDTLIYIDAPRSVRLDRARKRGWSENDFHAREQAQASLEWKRDRADRVIDNSGRADQTRTQVEQIWAELIGPGSPPSHP